MKRQAAVVNTARTFAPRRAGHDPESEESSDRTPRRLRPYPSLAAGRTASTPREPDWEFVICGDLSEKQYELLDRIAGLPRRSRGVIWFDSCGGSAYVGLSLASMIRLRGLDATAVVAGECSSAAIMPFAACERRFVSKHATLLFHPVRWHSEENVRREEAAEWARHFQVMEQDLDDLLSKLLPMEPDALAAWTRPGRFVTGDEVIAAGLAERFDLFGGDIWEQVGRRGEGERGRRGDGGTRP